MTYEIKVDAVTFTVRHVDMREGFPVYAYAVEHPGGIITGRDLQGGYGAANERAAMASLLSFAGAFAESVSYGERNGTPGENSTLFPVELAPYLDSDSLAIASEEIELA